MENNENKTAMIKLGAPNYNTPNGNNFDIELPYIDYNNEENIAQEESKDDN